MTPTWGAISTRPPKWMSLAEKTTCHMTYKRPKSVQRCDLWTRARKKERHGKKLDSGKLAIRPDHPRCRSATWICVCSYIREVATYSKFHRNPLKGLGATWFQNLPSPIDLASRLYDSVYCRTSRDRPTRFSSVTMQPLFSSVDDTSALHLIQH